MVTSRTPSVEVRLIWSALTAFREGQAAVEAAVAALHAVPVLLLDLPLFLRSARSTRSPSVTSSSMSSFFTPGTSALTTRAPSRSKTSTRGMPASASCGMRRSDRPNGNIPRARARRAGPGRSAFPRAGYPVPTAVVPAPPRRHRRIRRFRSGAFACSLMPAVLVTHDARCSSFLVGWRAFAFDDSVSVRVSRRRPCGREGGCKVVSIAVCSAANRSRRRSSAQAAPLEGAEGARRRPSRTTNLHVWRFNSLSPRCSDE